MKPLRAQQRLSKKNRHPQDRKVIIDSKVSLTAYETFASTTEIEQKEQAFKSHLQSVKKHIQDSTQRKR